MEPLLKAIDLSRRSGTLPALQRVSMEIYPGEVVGLAGESGSGKSVLAMLLAGLHTPDAGEISWEGRQIRSPFRARSLGIEVIHQTPSLAEHLDITSNVFLGSEVGWPPGIRWLKVLNRRRMGKEASDILDRLGVHFDSLREKVINLSSEQRQMIAIARTMTRPAKLIIIDDPALLLSYSYQQKLLSVIQAWQQQRTAVLFSSNNLDHLIAVTDRIVVLRQGCCVAEFHTDRANREEIVAAMVGTTDRQQITPIIWALDSYYRAREQAEKLRYRQTALERDLAAQDALKGQLIDQLAEQISALDSANTALQDAQRRLLTKLEQERKLLAREIHDQVIQDLLGVGYQLEEIETDETVSLALQEELSGIRNGVRQLVDDLRHICGSLRPPTIDSLGLGVALQSYTEQWGRRTGISVNLELDANLSRLPETTELSVFRIIQEGLRNVSKHANARTVEVFLKHTSPRTLMVSIADDGRGLAHDFDLSVLSSKGHYGLLGISERVALLGGRLHFENQPNGGLLIQAEIPHPRVLQTNEDH
jgi:signal transduction histidine kinase